jgi:hypothetical protein
MTAPVGGLKTRSFDAAGEVPEEEDELPHAASAEMPTQAAKANGRDRSAADMLLLGVS